MTPTTDQLPTHPGWHAEDVKAALRKRGVTLSELSRALGLRTDSCRKTLARPWPRCERAIARVLGVAPSEIWPDRYDADGRPLRSGAPLPERRRPARANHRHGRRAA